MGARPLLAEDYLFPIETTAPCTFYLRQGLSLLLRIS